MNEFYFLVFIFCVLLCGFSTGDEATGTRPDYLVNRADKKIQWPLGKKNSRKSRNSHTVSGWGVVAEGARRRNDFRPELSRATRSRPNFGTFCIYPIFSKFLETPGTTRTALPQWTLDSEPIMFVDVMVCACSRHACGLSF